MHLLLSGENTVRDATYIAGFVAAFTDSDRAVSAIGSAGAGASIAFSNIDALLLQAAACSCKTIRELVELVLPPNAHVDCSDARFEIVAIKASAFAWGDIVRTRRWQTRSDLIECIVAAATPWAAWVYAPSRCASAAGHPKTDTLFGHRRPIRPSSDPNPGTRCDGLTAFNSGALHGVDTISIMLQRHDRRTSARRPHRRPGCIE